MQMFTEEELGFESVEGIGSIAMVKRVRTLDPYDSWYVVDQVETYGGYRKRTTRTYTDIVQANNDYQKRLELMKEKTRCYEADVDGVSGWADRIRKAVNE